MSVGLTTNLTGVKTTHTISGQATGTAPIGGGVAPTMDVSYAGASKSWTFGNGAAAKINTIIPTIFTATKNTTTSLDVTGSLTGIFGETGATCAVIREMWFEYLTSVQDSTNGSNAGATATVKIKPSSSNPWITSPLEADGVIYMKLGEKLIWQNNDATGWAPTAGTGDKLDFVHAVNDFDAKFRITIFAEK
jgi:hypothetical protein